MKQTYSKNDLIDLAPQHDLLVAIDSDGCVFDSMSIKQRIFHTEIIKRWGFESAESDVRKIAEWVSLYSPWRGLNRFQLILKIFQALNDSGVAAFETGSLEVFVNSGVALSADELEKRIDETADPALQKVLDWSLEVSRQIAQIAEMPVFDEVFQGLEKLHAAADLIVVSQTTEDALVREWRHAGIEKFVDVIAGAELGSKAESLALAMKTRYAPDQVLMVGDAPGDLEAARAVGFLFFPIIPGDEVASWVELRETALDRVIDGLFFGAYQDDLINRFNTALSDMPPWL